MGKPRHIVYGDKEIPLPEENRSWARTAGTYIAGRAYVDEADATAASMEARWGCDRLRRLVGSELREKFDRQRYLFNNAIWHGELEDVRREAQRMVKAWLAVDADATARGCEQLSPKVWETTLSDGTVAAIVPDNDHAVCVMAQGRAVAVYTLDEIGRLLSGFPELVKAKELFPGATVFSSKRVISDPMMDLPNTRGKLDDELPW